MASTLCLSLLAAPGLAFVQTPFLGNQVNHAPALTARTARTSTRMVATPDKVNTGVKRNENFAKLKVSELVVVRGEPVAEAFVAGRSTCTCGAGVRCPTLSRDRGVHVRQGRETEGEEKMASPSVSVACLRGIWFRT